MLTEGNLKYLQTISDTELVRIVPFDPKTQQSAKILIAEIQKALPMARILYFGSSALGIDGENDIDVGIVDAGEYQSRGIQLQRIFGAPLKIDEKDHMMRWEFMRDGFVVELFLTDALEGKRREHIENHSILSKRPDLMKEYQQLKLESDRLSKREYMRKKLEFFNSLSSR